MKCNVQHPEVVCICGPERHRERCRWPAVASKGRCQRFDRRPLSEQRRSSAMLAFALPTIALRGWR